MGILNSISRLFCDEIPVYNSNMEHIGYTDAEEDGPDYVVKITDKEKQIADKIINIIKTGDVVETCFNDVSEFKKGDYSVLWHSTYIPIISIQYLGKSIYISPTCVSKYIVNQLHAVEHKDCEKLLENFLKEI